jgi:tetratricopeptide (TPR) repeat protein
MIDRGNDSEDVPRESVIDTRLGTGQASTRPSHELGLTLAGRVGRATGSDAGSQPEHEEPATTAGRPSWPTIGRYELRARLGSGGMGAVYEALDPSLDRAVAVKVLHAEMPRAAQQRMQREALALAKLSHPNVVQVFEVGHAGGHTFIAMELVRGQTLEAWARRRPRPSWREHLHVYAQAGAGLAAAHAVGLVHRDFKPSNCIVGDDGRVRVVDFGLAKDVSTHEGELDGPASHDGLAPVEPGITAWGAMVGTPAYMAPEQLAGQAGQPASDQFSLCASLWEALHGERPFRGETLGELSIRLLRGTIATPPAGVRVPRWLRDIVERGLAVDPEQRWPSVQALLEALARGQARVRWRRGLLALGAVGTTIAALAGWQRWDEERRARACEAAGASIAQVWNEDTATTMRSALIGTGVSRAAVTADAVAPWLDAQASAWRAARTEACLEAQVRGTWSAETLERSVWCLDERRMELEALVAELGSGQARTVDRAVKAAAGLGRVEPCGDALGLLRWPTPSGEQRDAVAAVWAELSRAGALQQTGAYDEGLAAARAVLARTEALAWPPLTAMARVRVGSLLERRGDYALAEAELEDAFFAAMEADAIAVAATAANRLVYVVGVDLDRHADGLRWSRHEQSLVSKLPDPARTQATRYLTNLANVRQAMGAYEEAKALYERALGLTEDALGPEHPDVAVLLNNLATVEGDLGRYPQARALFIRALEIRRSVLGPEHPDVGTSLNGLASVQAVAGEHEEARVSFEQALHIAESALGPDHPKVAGYLANLASVHQDLGEHEQAKALHERALHIKEAALGPDHPEVAHSLVGLGSVHRQQGATEEARALYERALLIEEATLGPDHPSVAGLLNNLASVHEDLGDHEQARALYERSLQRWEATLGLEHPDLAFPLVGLAKVALAQGRAADAVPLAERALRVREAGGVSAQLLAESRRALAQALWDAQQDRPRAVALAGRAREVFVELGDAEALAELDGWLAVRAR